ncbi:S-layer homology domain-containing protein [Paenibacillus alvei]|uniref:S-layer homology domain-containing protein n=1 Tax=Paenibacillus alvei TaxID=44250 RepID=UPI003B21E783
MQVRRSIVELSKSTATVTSGSTKTLFKDDAAIASWDKASVYQTAELGILKGNNAGTFLPKSQLTREQTFAMLTNLYQFAK